MLNSLHTTQIYVLDQDQALDFYVGKLGLEVNTDADLGFMRWLTVNVPGEPGRSIVLEKPGPPIMSDETAAQVRDLMTKGALGGHLFFATEDAAATHAQLKEKGVEVDDLMDQSYGIDFGLRDPFGNHVELVTGQTVLARPINFGRPAAGISEFGHLCLDAPDVRAAHEFWSTVFSGRVSDWIGDGACLMRIDPVHHKLAFFQNDAGAGFCHINFQVRTLDDVMRNWRFLQQNDVHILHGPGRHPTSTAIFVYFLGPDDLTYEYSFGVQLIEDDAAWRPRMFELQEPGSIDMWLGPTQRTVSQSQLAERPSVNADANPSESAVSV